jgi:hypothetical protein
VNGNLKPAEIAAFPFFCPFTAALIGAFPALCVVEADETVGMLATQIAESSPIPARMIEGFAPLDPRFVASLVDLFIEISPWLCARRPAPLQDVWVDWPATTLAVMAIKDGVPNCVGLRAEAG